MQENTQAVPEANAIALLPPAERAVIVLDATKTEARLRELVAASADITAVIDKDGREQAHRTAMVLRNARVAIEKTGKAARDDANAFNKAVIAKEKELVLIVQGEEDRVFALRDAFDAEQARIKAEAERKEAERKAAIRAKICTITALPTASFRDGSEQLKATLADLEGLDTSSAEFAEFAEEAASEKAMAITSLNGMLEAVVAAEAEAARIAAEKAELERQRAEQAERDRVAAEQRARDEAAAKAEADRLRKEREDFEAEKRAFAKQQEAAKNAAASKMLEAVAAAATPEFVDVFHEGVPTGAAPAFLVGSIVIADLNDATTDCAEPVAEVSNDNGANVPLSAIEVAIDKDFDASILRGMIRVMLDKGTSPNDIRAIVEDELAVAVAA